MVHFIHFVYILSLVCWIGGVIFFSFFTAPAIFKLLDREKAGELVGVVFPRYYFLGYVCSALALFCLISNTQSFFETKQILLLIMTVGWFYAGLVVSPKSKKLKVQRNSADSVEEQELLEIKFKKTHALAVRLNGFVLLVGLVLLWLSSEGLKL